MYEDKTLKCEECSSDFVFCAGEQKFFADKGFANLPKRCKTCKAKRAGNKKSGPVFTETICSECGTQTVVPFVPTQSRPVYCRECLVGKRKEVTAR